MKHNSDPTTWPTLALWVANLAPAKGFGESPMATLSYTHQLRHAQRVGAVKVGPGWRVPPGAKDPRVKPGVRR